MPPKTKKAPSGLVGIFRKAYNGATKISKKLVKNSKEALEFVKAQGGRVLWVAAVSTIMVLVPVLFEVQREGQCLNLERLVVEDFRKQGYTDQDLARMGYSTAVAPAVGLNDLASSAADSSGGSSS